MSQPMHLFRTLGCCLLKALTDICSDCCAPVQSGECHNQVADLCHMINHLCVLYISL